MALVTDEEQLVSLREDIAKEICRLIRGLFRMGTISSLEIIALEKIRTGLDTCLFPMFSRDYRATSS